MIETIAFFQKGMLAVVWLSLPPLAVAVVVGVLVSLLQAVLSVQDQSLPFAVKLLAVGVTLALMGRWMGVELLTMGEQAIDAIPLLTHRALAP
jgi:type III secretion protein S